MASELNEQGSKWAVKTQNGRKVREMNNLPRVMAMGEVMLEFSVADESQRTFALAYAGDTFNTAVHLARLGVPCGYFTELGDDPYSDGIVAFGQQEKVAMKDCIRSRGRLPGVYIIDNDDSGERRFHYWRDSSAARDTLSDSTKLQRACRAMEPYQVLYLSGVTLAVIAQHGGDSFWALIEQLKRQQKTIVFDPNYRNSLWPDIDTACALYRQLLGYCDVVLPTLDDETALWGFTDSDEVVDFYRALGVREVVVKLPGAQAVAVNDHDSAHRQSLFRGPVIDTTGAGDAFNAGYLNSRYRNQSLGDALAAAHSLAAQVIAVRGAIPSTKPDGETAH